MFGFLFFNLVGSVKGKQTPLWQGLSTVVYRATTSTRNKQLGGLAILKITLKRKTELYNN